MSILSGYKKIKRYLKESSGYKLVSQWTSSKTVEMGNGINLEDKMESVDDSLALKAPLANPTLTGTPKAPTASAGTNTTQIATTAFVQTATSNHNISTTAHDDIRELITGLTTRLNTLADSDDTTLDQLSEIVAYIKSNKSLIDGITTSKVDKVSGKGLSTNDYTTTEKNKLASIADNANNYSLPVATSSVRGGVKIGYTQSGKNYPVQLSNEQMYVNVPWTTYSVMTAATASAAGTSGLVPAPTAGAQTKYLRGDGTWQTPPDTNTTYTAATESPKANGTAAVGTSAKFAREDHVHPLQTSVSGSSGSCTGNAATATKATNDSDGNKICTTYLKRSGGTSCPMTGNIAFQGTKSTYEMIKFLDNTTDANGNGIVIGGGGAVVIGGGESSDVLSNTSNGVITGSGTEKLVLGSDTSIELYTNCNDGFSSAKKIVIGENGVVTMQNTDSPQVCMERKDSSGNTVRKGSFQISAGNRLGIWDTTNSKWLLYSEPNGDAIFNGTATKDLPLTGGTITGDVGFKGSKGISFGSDYSGSTKISSGGHVNTILFTLDNEFNVRYTSPGDASSNTYAIFEPYTGSTSVIDLGSNSNGRKWRNIYAASGTISTSDRTQKEDISYIGQDSEYDTAMTDEQLKKFINELLPCIYRMIDGTSGRPHHGLIAQDIEYLMKEIGLSDHAAFIKTPKTKEIEIEKEIEVEIEDPDTGEKTITTEVVKEIQYEDIPGEYNYALRYEEFIADIIRFIQLQDNQIEDLENRIAALELLVNK